METIKRKYFIVIAPDDTILTEKQWSEIVGDNILFWGKKRKQKSPYNILDLHIVTIDE